MKMPRAVTQTIASVFDENGDPCVSVSRGREILTACYRKYDPKNDRLCRRLSQTMRAIRLQHQDAILARQQDDPVAFFDLEIAGSPCAAVAAPAKAPVCPDDDPLLDFFSEDMLLAWLPPADKARYARLSRLLRQREQWLFTIQDELRDAWFVDL